jgi:hypothetical protein
MTKSLSVQAVPVSESPPDATRLPDYADAFAVARAPDDLRTAEDFARDGFARLPPRAQVWGRLAHRHLLGFDLGPTNSSGHLFGWRIARSTPVHLHLQARGGRMDGDMLWRFQADQLVLTTFVRFAQPLRARLVWAWAGRLHRGSVPLLLARAAQP